MQFAQATSFIFNIPFIVSKEGILQNINCDLFCLSCIFSLAQFQRIRHEIYTFGFTPDMQEGEDDVPYTAEELAPRLLKGYDGDPVSMVTGSWKHTLFLTRMRWL
jgi:hypothetical protein